MLSRIKNFLEEARREWRNINWPTRQEAVRLTAVVIFLSLALAVFLGFFDYLFAAALRAFVLR